MSSRSASALHVCATWQCPVSWQPNAPVRDAAARHPCIPEFERGAQPGEQLHGAAESLQTSQYGNARHPGSGCCLRLLLSSIEGGGSWLYCPGATLALKA